MKPELQKVCPEKKKLFKESLVEQVEQKWEMNFNKVLSQMATCIKQVAKVIGKYEE